MKLFTFLLCSTFLSLGVYAYTTEDIKQVVNNISMDVDNIGRVATFSIFYNDGGYVEVNKVSRSHLLNKTEKQFLKIMLIEEWIRTNINYKKNIYGYKTIKRTLKTQEGDCTEYALLGCYMVKQLNISCRHVYGKYDDTLHLWNEYEINNVWVNTYSTVDYKLIYTSYNDRSYPIVGTKYYPDFIKRWGVGVK